MNEALLIIDMQKYFYDLSPEIFNNKIIPNLKKQISVFRNSQKKIIHIRTIYSNDKSNWPKIRKSDSTIWCLENSGSEEYILGFEPQKGENEVIKTRYSSFFETNLGCILKEEKIEKLFIGGFSSDVCIRSTAFDAYNEGFEIFLLKDCMHSFKENFKDSLEYLEWVLKAKSV